MSLTDTQYYIYKQIEKSICTRKKTLLLKSKLASYWEELQICMRKKKVFHQGETPGFTHVGTTKSNSEIEELYIWAKKPVKGSVEIKLDPN